ncbi:uncharacterized protein LOC117153542 [Bombus vancouverensis nearcticus]|uniref:Uncharacterized protein LOC117211688 n=1 Tax=Bombus bifarius TaxID=103933 RepID=A0A6P8MTJ4_9HYME|nr:uncharacterized protein LOC117153542 [Bombus vancouverensis nearcticus]XP_033311738.1 uncharacterized protein LOC117211688 [Bombus bifarius]
MSFNMYDIKNQRDSGNNDEVVEAEENQEEKEKLENRRKFRRKSMIYHSISLIVLHALEALLLIILLPVIIWQWVSVNHRLKIILKTVVEVTLELVMWVIFAGVSVLMTTTFVLEDIYHGKNDYEKLKQLINTRDEPIRSSNETPNFFKEQSELILPEN